MGTVYLIHFDTPLHHARHYLGWASNFNHRIDQHKAGTGARLMAVVAEQGITWQVSRTWKGDRTIEARLKRYHGSVQLCPLCNPNAAKRGNV